MSQNPSACYANNSAWRETMLTKNGQKFNLLTLNTLIEICQIKFYIQSVLHQEQPNFVRYNGYWVSIRDADGLVLRHQDVSRHNDDQYLIILPGFSSY